MLILRPVILKTSFFNFILKLTFEVNLTLKLTLFLKLNFFWS